MLFCEFHPAFFVFCVAIVASGNCDDGVVDGCDTLDFTNFRVAYGALVSFSRETILFVLQIRTCNTTDNTVTHDCPREMPRMEFWFDSTKLPTRPGTRLTFDRAAKTFVFATCF